MSLESPDSLTSASPEKVSNRPASTQMSAKASRWLLPGVLLVTLLVFLPALHGGLVWDDHFLLENDARVTGPFSLLKLLTPYWTQGETVAGPSYARPLVTLTFAVQHALTGLTPLPLHLVNVLLHLLNGLLMWQVWRRFLPEATTSERWFRAGLLLLLLILPLQVEPVAWVAGRTDLLAMSFGLMALCLLPLPIPLPISLPISLPQTTTSPHPPPIAAGLSLPDGVRWALMGGLLLASLLSKEVALAFVGLSIWWSLGAGLPKKTALGLMATSTAALVGWYSLRQIAILSVEQPGVPESTLLPPLFVVWLRVVSSLGRYWEMLLWPWNPSALVSMRSPLAPSSPWFWLGLLSLGASVWLLVRIGLETWAAVQRASSPLEASEGPRPDTPQVSQVQLSWRLGQLWVMLGLLPVVNILPLAAPSPVAERFWYVPLGGLSVCGVLVLRRVLTTRPEWQRALSMGLVACLLASAGVSHLRAGEWQSDRTLWEAEVARHGIRHILTARNLGVARQLEGDVPGAIQAWQAGWNSHLGMTTSHRVELGIRLVEALRATHRQTEADALRHELMTNPNQPLSAEQQKRLGE